MATTLSDLLVHARRAKGVSLRDVEKETDISNAYISQLEAGSIKEPSPHKLYTLAEYYGLKYQSLMQLAGYAADTSGGIKEVKPSSAQTLLLTEQGLTNEEAAALVAFLTQYRKLREEQEEEPKRERK